MNNKNLKKRLASLLLCLVLLIAASGCGAQSKKYANEGYYDYGDNAPLVSETEESKNYSYASASGLTTQRKLVYTANATIKTKNFDEVKDKLISDVTGLGGYISAMDISGGGVNSGGALSPKNATIHVRIPVDKYETFIESLSDYGTLANISSEVADVTEAYTDIESRLSALEKEKAQLEALLERATDVSDIIEISSRLSNVIYEIESYTAQKRNYDNQISYSTVTIYLRDISEQNVIAKTFGDDLWEAVRNSWVSVINFMQGAVIVIIWIIPYALLLGIVLLIVKKLMKAYRAKHPYNGEGKADGFFARKKKQREELKLAKAKIKYGAAEKKPADEVKTEDGTKE